MYVSLHTSDEGDGDGLGEGEGAGAGAGAEEQHLLVPPQPSEQE